MLLLNHVSPLLTKRKGFQGLGELKNLCGAWGVGGGWGCSLGNSHSKGGGGVSVQQRFPRLGPGGCGHWALQGIPLQRLW